MGNVLVSGLPSRGPDGKWTWGEETTTFAWIAGVLSAIFAFVHLKPWGIVRERKKAIERVNKTRTQRFKEWADRVSNIDAQERDRILSLSLFELRDALQSEKITAVQALEAYVWKTNQAQEKLNCCIEFLREAFEIASDLDEEYNGKKKPALFGIPFSVKGNFHMIGYDCSIGFGKLVEQPCEDECSFVTHLKSLGAVPFVLTNVPQALLSFVCSNAAYGTTGNPHDPKRTPGGSSGGEAAMVSARATPFGTGSDLAGSLRIPAGMCGIVSMKPTEARFVVTGSHGGVPGKGRLGLSFGFFTHSVEEQVFLLSTIVGDPKYVKLVPHTAPLPLDLNIVNETKRLKIGYYEEDPFLAPVPAMRRAVVETVERLKAAGHELVRFELPDVLNITPILYKDIMPDRGEYVLELYKHDVVDEHMKQFVTLLGFPAWLRFLAAKVVSLVSPQMAIVANAYVRDLADLRLTQELTDDYKLKFIKKWQEAGLDGLVCPSFVVPAVPHKYPSQLAPCAFATAIWNFVDFPAGVVPTGKVTEDDDKALADENKWKTGYNPMLKIVRAAAADSAGLPISVQAVTLPYQEEQCLRLMSEIEKCWK